MSADGEQVEDDADRIHNGAEELEQFIKDILLGAKGSRKSQPSTSSYFQILPTYFFFFSIHLLFSLPLEHITQ